MSTFLVAVIDHSHARLFALTESDFPEQSPPVLLEQQHISNPMADQTAQALWTNIQSGHNRATVSHTHGYDDHRDDHLREFDRRFATQIVNELLTLHNEHQSDRLILAAEPQILGVVRNVLSLNQVKSLKVRELAKDLGKFSPPEIHQYLADRDLLPKPYRLL
jgi:protein required for attachment to host cells